NRRAYSGHWRVSRSPPTVCVLPVAREPSSRVWGIQIVNVVSRDHSRPHAARMLRRWSGVRFSACARARAPIWRRGSMLEDTSAPSRRCHDAVARADVEFAVAIVATGDTVAVTVVVEA